MKKNPDSKKNNFDNNMEARRRGSSDPVWDGTDSEQFLNPNLQGEEKP